MVTVPLHQVLILSTVGYLHFDVNFNMVLMDESESEAFFNGPVVNYVGLTSIPEYRYTVDVGHTLMSVPNLYMSLQYEYIDEIADTTGLIKLLQWIN